MICNHCIRHNSPIGTLSTKYFPSWLSANTRPGSRPMLTLVSKFLIRIKYGDDLNAKVTTLDSWNHGYGFMQTTQKFFLTKKTLHKYVTYSQVSKSPSKNAIFSWLPCRVCFIFITLDLLWNKKQRSKWAKQVGDSAEWGQIGMLH